MLNNCRDCGHFFRVMPKEHGLSYLGCAGFCILGMLEGNFSLYHSTSTSKECGAFFLSDYNTVTTNMEQTLSKKLEDFRTAMLDGRTKEFKLLYKTCDDAVKEYMKDSHPLNRWCMLNKDFADAFREVFISINRDELMALIYRKRMQRCKYFEIIGSITTTLKISRLEDLLSEYQSEEVADANKDHEIQPQVDQIQ